MLVLAMLVFSYLGQCTTVIFGGCTSNGDNTINPWLARSTTWNRAWPLFYDWNHQCHLNWRSSPPPLLRTQIELLLREKWETSRTCLQSRGKCNCLKDKKSLIQKTIYGPCDQCCCNFSFKLPLLNLYYCNQGAKLNTIFSNLPIGNQCSNLKPRDRFWTKIFDKDQGQIHNIS